jgi:6-pyruvoyltetrahydropterin/6-carboxytetrahydropterin synthase
MNERFSIQLRKAVHVFAAGHFITLTDDLCEAVHGHNWTVGVDVEAEPDAHGMVVDFIALRDLVTRIVSRLDHRMLLPADNPLLEVTTAAGPTGRAETTVRFQDRRWVFPADECVVLPIRNTTAEWIARWIGIERLGACPAAGIAEPRVLRVAVDECLGQSGVWERGR